MHICASAISIAIALVVLNKIFQELKQLKAFTAFSSIAAIMSELRSFKAVGLPEWEF